MLVGNPSQPPRFMDPEVFVRLFFQLYACWGWALVVPLATGWAFYTFPHYLSALDLCLILSVLFLVSDRKQRHRCLYLVATFIAIHTLTTYRLSRLQARKIPASDEGKSFHVQGRIAAVYENRRGYALTLKKPRTLSPIGRRLRTDRLLVYLPEGSTKPKHGGWFDGWIRLHQRQQPRTIPIPMAELTARFRADLYGSVKTTRLVTYDPDRHNQDPLSAANRQLVGALFQGQPSDIWRKTLEPFGLGHLLAVSGLHCALFFLLLQGVLFPLRSPYLRLCLTLPALLGFAHAMGWSASVTRATLTLIIWFLMPYFNLPRSNIRIWAQLFSLGLLWDPSLWLSRGFRTSFAVTLGLLTAFRRRPRDPRDHPWLRILRPFSVIAAAQMMVIPITLLWDARVSPQHLLWNGFGSIVLGVLILTASLALATSWSATLSQLSNSASDGLLDLLMALQTYLPTRWIYRFPSEDGMVLVFGVCVSLCLYKGPREFRWYGAMFLTVMFLFMGKPHQGSGLFLLDSGQGLAMVLKNERGEGILLDAGGRFGGGLTAEEVLQVLGTDLIKAALISHDNRDHYNLLEQCSANIPVYSSAIRFRAFAAIQATAPHPRRPLLPGQGLRFGGFRLLVLHPPSHYPSDNANEASLTVFIDHSDFAVLFTGDIGHSAEAHIPIPEVGNKPFHLVVGHHGSRGSTSDAFLERGRFTTALIAAGKGNRFGHPHPETIARLNHAGIRTFSTATLGTLEISAEIVPLDAVVEGR